MNPATDHEVQRVREFNRFWTRTIGALDEAYLGSGHSLTEIRVLFEISVNGSPTAVTELREQLGLDAGYLSRILTRLEREDLAVRSRSAEDGRRQQVEPTAKGRAVHADLDRASRTAMAGLLGGITPAKRRHVVTAMSTVREALDPLGTTRAAARPVIIREPRPGDLGWVVRANAEVFAAEHGFGPGYEALVARIVADYAAEHDPRREAAWIAETEGEPVGSIMCIADPEDPAVARLRLLVVSSRARGLGLGAQLVRTCIEFARRAGYREMKLWTVNLLDSARRIYQAEGFELQHSAPHGDFGREVTGQTWGLKL
jgi:DNA-binding MarR family transcriptional regulator/GNAT superfamily N-acetyltransferase